MGDLYSRLTTINPIRIALLLVSLATSAPNARARDAAMEWQWSGRDRDERLENAPQFEALAQHPLGSRLISAAEQAAQGALDYLAPALSEALVTAIADADVVWRLWVDASGKIDGYWIALRGNETANDLITTAASAWAESDTGCDLRSLQGGAEDDWTLASGPDQWNLSRLHHWTVLRHGLAVEATSLEEILRNGTPSGWKDEGYLRLRAALPQLFPGASETLPLFSGVWSVESGKARTRGTLTFARAPEVTTGPLRLPDQIVKDPISSFAVFRGLDAVFPRAAERLESWGLPHLLSELYVWSEDHGWTLPYVTHFAAPMPDATSRVRQFAERILPDATAALTRWGLGNLETIEAPVQIHWKNLPLILPFLRAVGQGGSSFVTGGFFPLEQHTDPAPEALLKQVRNRPELRAYHWEVTPLRFSQIARLQSIGNVLVQVARASASDRETLFAPPLDWTALAEPFSEGFANAITEVVADSPTEWRLTRTSGLGFTALEWNLILMWLQEQGAFSHGGTPPEPTQPNSPPSP